MKVIVARVVLAGVVLQQSVVSTIAVFAGQLSITDAVTTSVFKVVRDANGNDVQIGPVAISGIGALETGFQTNADYYHDIATESASAGTGGTGSTLLRAYAAFYDPYGHATNDSAFNASGLAIHQDIVYLNQASHADAIRLNFLVEGSFEYEQLGPPLNPDYDYANFSVVFGGAEFGLRIRGNAFNAQTESWASGWDGYTAYGPTYFDGGYTLDFQGTYHVDATWSEQYGGYYFYSSLQAIANGSNGAGSADFGHTASLITVTDLNGNPLGNLDFDSGLKFANSPDTSVVPEPSSLCIAATALVFGGLYRRRKSRLTSQQTPSDEA